MGVKSALFNLTKSLEEVTHSSKIKVFLAYLPLALTLKLFFLPRFPLFLVRTKSGLKVPLHNLPIQDHEPWMQKYICPRKGDVCLDIGAHVGLHTIWMAKRANLVLAIEPDSRLFRILRENVSENGLEQKVVCKNVALSDKNGSIWLYCGGLGLSTFSSKKVKLVRCEARTLDRIVEEEGLSRVDWIKIDVDGSEVKVLKGAFKTVRKSKPTMVIESSFGLSLRKLTQLLHNLGYQTIIIEETSKAESPYILAMRKIRSRSKRDDG